MKCLFCGTELSEEAKCCPVCGSPISAASNSKIGEMIPPVQHVGSSSYENPFPNQKQTGYYTSGDNEMTKVTPEMLDRMTNDKKSKNKRIIVLVSTIGALVIAVVVILIVLLNSEKKSKEKSSTYDISTGYEASERNRDVTVSSTREEAKRAFEELIEKAIDYYKVGNKAGFSSLFSTSTPRDHIESLYNSFSENYDGLNYPDVQTEVVWDDGEYYLCQYTRSMIVLEEGDHWSSKRLNVSMPITKENDVWKLTDVNDEDWGKKELYPQKVLDAFNEGRNVTTFEVGDLSWVNEKLVIPGDFIATVFIVYQNNDGSVDALVNLKNGTDSERTVEKLSITLEDEQLGTIVDFSTTSPISVEAQKAKNIWVHIEAEAVLTGKSKWGYVKSHCGIDYSPKLTH